MTSAWLPTLTIDGQAVATDSSYGIVNPATGSVFAQAPDGNTHLVDQAVRSARNAFPQWSQTPLSERQALVRAVGKTLEANVDELSGILVREQGKPLASAKMDVLSGAMWCAGMADINLPTETIEDGPQRLVRNERVPLGVVAGIVPWNFPIGLAFWKIAPALVAGNCVIIKPSPFTPLTTLRAIDLVKDILPAGVLNVISGKSDQLGATLAGNPGIDKISFTGSVAVGVEVMRAAAADLKRVTLELGGNDAAIILADADIDECIEPLFWAAFRNTGQFCVAAKRIYIHDDIYDIFADAFRQRVLAATIGEGFSPDVQLGPIQNQRQFERVKAMIERARLAGLRFLTGDQAIPSEGYFVAPTVIDNPPDDAEVVTAEAFGPIVPLLRFHDMDDVIRRANATDYGLAASIWTTSAERGRKIASRLDVGTVWINEIHYMSPHAPFGGHKHSGVGVENGLHGLMEYTNSRTIVEKR